MSNPKPARRPRRWWKALVVASIAVLGLFAALPLFIATAPGRSRVAAGLNQALAPGRLRFEGLHLSWFGPTRLKNVTLLDPKGETVASVPTAVFDKTLGQLILGSSEPSVLTLDDAALVVERSADGVINLADALRTLVAHPDPKRDITIRIDHGSLRYRDPFLAEPAIADAVDFTMHLAAAPYPLTWSLKLGRGRDASLEIQGDFDRWLSKGGPPRTPELEVGIVGKRWPFVARTAGLDATGRLDGTLDFARKRGRWVLTGDARLDGLKARGKILSGDTLAFDRLEAGWDLSQGETGWAIRRLSLKSPLGDLKAEGQLNAEDGSGKQRIEGMLDLAAIARQLPHALQLRDGLTVEGGSARVGLDLETNASESTYDIEARVADLAAKDHDRNLTLREPATLTARLTRKSSDSSVDQLTIKTSFLQASAKGKFQDGVNLEGSLDLDHFRRQLGEWVDLGGLEMAGKVDLKGIYQVHPAGSLESISERMQVASGNTVTSSPQPIPSPMFFHSIEARFRDLKIDGMGIGPIRRDAVTMNLSMDGPVDASGFPLDWRAMGLLFRSGGSEARLRLDPNDGNIRFSASARTPLSAGDQAKFATFDAQGDWSSEARVLTLAEVGCGFPQISTTARGKLDLASGELILEPVPGKSSAVLGLTPDGLKITGLGQGLDSLRFEGGLSGDSAALDQMVSNLAGRPPMGLTGRWSALANARGNTDGVQVAGKIGLDAPDAQPGRPTALALRAHYSTQLDRLDLSEFTVSTAYGTLEASGQLDDPSGSRKIDLKGKLAPDFGVINALLARKVEPGAKIEGNPRAFRASGTLGDSSDGWKGLDAEFGFDLAGADIYGMKFGPSPVVLRAKNGKLPFDPISTSLNEGHIRLEPELDLDTPGGPTLRLAKNSVIRDARINDEVSKRVLAYVAPVLDKTTRASGLVSVDLDHAEFPIGPGRGRQAKVEGAVVFQDVEFAPGPLAADLLAAIGRRDLTLKLDQPVTLTIADGRINQRGMAIPIADFTRIELAGWVDFDRNLSLNATVPVTAAMLGNNPILSDIAAGTRVKLPIGGTLDHPKIDREAFTANLQELGKSLLTRGATRGALDLLMRLGRPRDPDAPPPQPRLTPQERRALRQEKKAIRRGELPPTDSPKP